MRWIQVFHAFQSDNQIITAMKLKTILILLCILAVAACHRANRTRSRTRPSGWTSGVIVAQQDIGKDPSQYFLCGFQLRGRQWTTTINQKVVGFRRWRRWLRSPRRFRNMTNGVKFIFCNDRDWKVQITKTIESGDKNTTGWRQAFMCPPQTYASGLAPKFMVIRGVDQGLTGLRLECSTAALDKTQLVDDKTNPNNPELLKGEKGTFISTLRVKLEKGYKLTGIILGFESMSVITGFNFKFNVPADLALTAVEATSVSESNPTQEETQKTLVAEKQLVFLNNWKLNKTKSYVNNYQVNVTAPPSLFPFKPEAQLRQYLTGPQTFAFNSELKSVLSLKKQILAAIPTCTAVSVITTIKQKAVEIPFKVTITYSSKFSGKLIGDIDYEGVWSGTYTGEAEDNPSQSPIPGCQAPRPAQNLRSQTP